MTKLEALKRALAEYGKGTFIYNWSHADKCNCGLVVRCALDLSASDVRKTFSEIFPNGKNRTWKGLVNEVCTISGKTTHAILKDLFSMGFTKEDVVHLEYLSDPVVVAEVRKLYPTKRSLIKNLLNISVPPEPLNYEDSKDLHKYLIAWVKILEREDQQKSRSVVTADGLVLAN